MGIKPGDLVMVVRATPCCGSSTGCGEVFVAGAAYSGDCKCRQCGLRSAPNAVWVEGRRQICDMSRLIKIDPLADEHTTEHAEELYEH